MAMGRTVRAKQHSGSFSAEVGRPGRAWKMSLNSDQATRPHGSMVSELLPPWKSCGSQADIAPGAGLPPLSCVSDRALTYLRPRRVQTMSARLMS